MAAQHRPWWRDTLLVGLRSSTDGVGDLAGSRSRPPYLSELEVDALRLTPFPAPLSAPPLVDGGHDVAGGGDVLPSVDAPRRRHADRPGPRARTQGDHRPGTHPHLRPASLPASLVPGRAGGGTRRPGPAAVRVPSRARGRRERILRTTGPRCSGARPGSGWRRTPAPGRPAAAGPQLGPPRGTRGVPVDPALLAGPGRVWLPRRRRRRPGHGVLAARPGLIEHALPQRPRPTKARRSSCTGRRGVSPSASRARRRDTAPAGVPTRRRSPGAGVWLRGQPGRRPVSCPPTSSCGGGAGRGSEYLAAPPTRDPVVRWARPARI